MGKFGYDFYFKIGEEVLTLPITPSSLKMRIGSNNKVVTLINEGDINILKSPTLAEFEFDARFPMRKYPYSRDALNFEVYLNKFTALKTKKTPFVFNVIRTTPDGKGTWATFRRVTLEDLEIEENADEGDDVIVSFKLKEYKEYGVKQLNNPNSTPTATSTTTSTSEQPRSTDNKITETKEYTVRNGDTLWAIAKAKYNDGSKWIIIYEANKAIIEDVAEKQRGKGKGSSNGHWIYSGTKLIIPPLDSTTITKVSTNIKYTLTVQSTGSKDYVGSFTVIVDGQIVREMRQADTFTPFTIKLKSGSTVEIKCNGVNGHSYSISSNKFKMTTNKTVTIKWVR